MIPLAKTATAPVPYTYSYSTTATACFVVLLFFTGFVIQPIGVQQQYDVRIPVSIYFFVL